MMPWRILLAAMLGFACASLPPTALAADDLVAGKATYEGGCVACHGTGVLGAPKVGDAAAWAPRAAGGIAALVVSSRNGKNAMPPRGGMPTLSDQQLRDAVAYMLSRSSGPAAAAKPAAPPAPAKAAAPARAASSVAAAAPARAAAPAPAAPAAPPAAARASVPAPAAAAPPPAAVPQLAAVPQDGGVNAFNRLLRAPGVGNRPPAEDGIHDPANDGTLALQPPATAFRELSPGTGGNRVDWGKSLREGKLNPRAGLDPKAVPAVMDLNIVREVKGSMPDVVYPHKQHTEWLDCANCHPALFKPQKGANQLSMAGILLGQQCGVCHGKVAFPVSECRLCHSRPKANATAQALPTTAPPGHLAPR